MYWDYVKEREGVQVMERPYGFALIKMQDETTLYIQDVYIKPEFRNYKTIKELFYEIQNIAKEHGVTTLVTTIDCSTNGATKALKCNLHVGFELLSSDSNVVCLIKRLS